MTKAKDAKELNQNAQSYNKVKEACTVLSLNVNKNELKIYEILNVIKSLELWKKEAFWKDAKDKNHYMNKKFTAFAEDLFGRSSSWFRSIEKILIMKDGRNLIMKHGRANMVAYMGFSPEEKDLARELAQDKPNATFHSLLKSAGLRGQNVSSTKNMWKTKYEEVLNKNKELEQALHDLTQKYNALMDVLKFQKQG